MRWKKVIRPSNIDNLQSNDNQITFLLYSGEDEYLKILSSELEDAAEKAGYNLKILDSKNSSIIQLAQVKAARDTGQKAIILNIVDPYEDKDIIDAAGDMKIVFINRFPIDMTLLNENRVYVGSNDSIAGELQGEFLADYFNKQNKKDIKYILIEGTNGLPTTIERTNSALEALTQGGINATAASLPIEANFSRSEAMNEIFPLLISNTVFDAIIANNDAMALGAIDALRSIGMDPSQTPIVGIDAIYPAFMALRDGTLAMTVFQNAKEQAKTTIDVIANMLEDRPFDSGIKYSISPDYPYTFFIPVEPVTWSHIPDNLEYTLPSYN